MPGANIRLSDVDLDRNPNPLLPTPLIVTRMPLSTDTP